MVAGPSKGPDRNQKPSTSTSTCTSTIPVFVDVDVDLFVDVDVLVDVDVFFKFTMEVKHTPENVKLRRPPRLNLDCGTHLTLWVFGMTSRLSALLMVSWNKRPEGPAVARPGRQAGIGGRG